MNLTVGVWWEDGDNRLYTAWITRDGLGIRIAPGGVLRAYENEDALRAALREIAPLRRWRSFRR